MPPGVPPSFLVKGSAMCDDGPVVTSEQMAEENLRMKRARVVVDLTCALLRQQPSLTHRDADRIIEGARTSILSLFPGGEPTFSLVLKPRFERIVRERGVGVSLENTDSMERE